MPFLFIAEDDSVVDIGFAASQMRYQVVNQALKCCWGVLHSKQQNFILFQSIWSNHYWDLLYSICQKNLPKSFKQIKMCNIFGLSNVIDAIINSQDGKCVQFGDIVYFTVVCTHVKCPIRFRYKTQGELHLLSLGSIKSLSSKYWISSMTINNVDIMIFLSVLDGVSRNVFIFKKYYYKVSCLD